LALQEVGDEICTDADVAAALRAAFDGEAERAVLPEGLEGHTFVAKAELALQFLTGRHMLVCRELLRQDGLLAAARAAQAYIARMQGLGEAQAASEVALPEDLVDSEHGSDLEAGSEDEAGSIYDLEEEQYDDGD
jgi:hypothetical protein